VTGVDLDELERLVAASEAVSPAPWRDVRGETVDRDGERVGDSADHYEDRRSAIALRNAAPELIALAREALAARETYRVVEEDDLTGDEGPSVLCEGRSLEWCRGYLHTDAEGGYKRRIVRERDGEVVS
jgi:hypothetical protein